MERAAQNGAIAASVIPVLAQKQKHRNRPALHMPTVIGERKSNMGKTLSYDMDDFRKGLILLNDDSTAPVGSAREMQNVFITDRGGISPRPGTEMLGARKTAVNRGRGFFVFKKSYDEVEIPMIAYDTKIEVYDPDSGWFLLKDGYTADKVFGFVHNFVVTDNEDYVYFCNRYEPFQRWNGQIVKLNGALAGGETSIVVDSTIRPDIFSTAAATAATTTTIDQNTETWAVDQWKNMYVHVTSGAQAGQVRKITSNTATQITFAALPGAPAIGDTFDIVESRFDLSENDKFIYNDTEITVTAINTNTTLTVASAHAAPDGTPLTNVPQEYPAAPRGNRLETLKGRTWVGRVRSGMARDNGGVLQGSNTGASIFGSKLKDPTDFSYAAPRIAGEGIVAAVPYGGGEMTDVAAHENVIYVYKKNYIESFTLSDSDDALQRDPQKSEAGSVGRVIKGKDDHYFVTLDNQFTSLGRVQNKDLTVQTENIGLPIKRLLDTYNFEDMNGIEYRNRILFSARSSAGSTENDSTIVWNKTTRSFEGVWNIGAHAFDIYNGELHYIESDGPNVWKMFLDRKSDTDDADELPIAALWQSNFFNLTPIKGNYQAINSIAFEGYIAANTTFTFRLYKDFADSTSYEFDFGGLDDEEFLVGSTLASFLGSNPLGLQPIGTVDAPGSDGRRRFQFLVYIPYLYGQYFSIGFGSSGKDQNWEIIRASLGVRESISTVRPNIRPA